MIILMNIIMLILMLGLATAVVWYTAFRLHTLFDFVPYSTIIAIITTLMVLSMIALFAFMMPSNKFTGTLNIISGYVILFLTYLFFMLAILHIIQLFWHPSVVLIGTLAILLAITVTVVAGVSGSGFVVNETEIRIASLEQELRIMQISDVHLGHKRGAKYLEKIVQKTQEYSPDLVLLTGDLIESRLGLLPDVLSPLQKFDVPVYFVEGNHDKYVGIAQITTMLTQNNVRVLHNEVVETHGIQLIGLAYLKADDETFDMHPSDNTDTVKSVMSKIDLHDNSPKILMAHSPVGIKYIESADVDFMLAGHTHSGQIFPFSLLARLSFPYFHGIYEYGGLKIFVSSGVGTFGIKARLGSKNEINLIKLDS